MRRLITALALHACTAAPPPDASRARLAPAATDLPTSDRGISADPQLVDLDQNGDPELVDLLEFGPGAGLFVVHNLTDGGAETTWEGVFDLERGGRLVTEDFNGDGTPDVAHTSANAVWLYPGPDLSGPQMHVGDGVVRDGAWNGAARDIDGDGASELALPVLKNGDFRVLVWRGGPEFAQHPPAWTLGDRRGPAGHLVTFADVDGDGDDDLVTATEEAVSAWLVEGGELRSSQTVLWSPLPALPSGLQTAPDVDGDGDDELIITFLRVMDHPPGRPWSGLVLLLGGSLEERWLPVAEPAPPVAVTDVDGDGHTDLVAALPDAAALLWLPGGPDGPSAARAYRSTPPDLPQVVMIGAFAGHAVVQWLERGLTYRRLLQLTAGDEDEDQDGFPATVDPDDRRPEAWPGAPEIRGNGLDEDGDGWDICAIDMDQDGFTTSSWLQVAGRCRPLGLNAPSATLDCDDSDAQAHPGAPEPPGAGADLNCDGLLRCFRDADDDGYPTEELLLPNDADCDDPGETSLSQIRQPFDCDDTDPDVNPSRRDLPGDGVDQNCDGVDLGSVQDAESGCQHAPAPLFLGLLGSLRWRRRDPRRVR